MEIHRTIPPLQINNLPPEAAIRQMAVYVENNLRRMQEEIYTLRQFLEPAITNNSGSPEQVFNPLS